MQLVGRIKQAEKPVSPVKAIFFVPYLTQNEPWQGIRMPAAMILFSKI